MLFRCPSYSPSLKYFTFPNLEVNILDDPLWTLIHVCSLNTNSDVFHKRCIGWVMVFLLMIINTPFFSELTRAKSTRIMVSDFFSQMSFSMFVTYGKPLKVTVNSLKFRTHSFFDIIILSVFPFFINFVICHLRWVGI